MNELRKKWRESRALKPKCYCRYAIRNKHGDSMLECIRPRMKNRGFCKRHGTAGR